MSVAVFGDDSPIHPVTGMRLERGRGCLPDYDQAMLHCVQVEKTQGSKVADAMRKKIKAGAKHGD